MAVTYLDYQINSRDIAREFVTMGIAIPLSFALVGALIIYYGQKNQPAAVYAIATMVSLSFLILQSIAWWYFRHPNFYVFRITADTVEYKTKIGGYRLELNSIERIQTSRTLGGETSTIDYFLITNTGESFKIPKIHKLPDGKIIKILMKANPAIIGK